MEATNLSILQFSEYLIKLFAYKGEPLTNKKLQKLLYYVHAWHLVYFDGKSLFEEKPQAWRHGPVYPSVYVKYKDIGFYPLIPKSEPSLEDLNMEFEKFNFSAEQTEYIESVLNYYGSKNAIQLEVMSHSELPWIEARRGYGKFDKCNEIISPKTMKEYYSQLQKS